MTTDNCDDDNKVSAADEARAKAEARRKRILEKSRDRMSIVSGEQLRVPTEATHVDSASPTATDTATADSVDAEDAAHDTVEGTPSLVASQSQSIQPEGDENAKPSGSARMNAMRRRRFAKKKDEDEEDAATVSKTATAEVVSTAPVSTIDDKEEQGADNMSATVTVAAAEDTSPTIDAPTMKSTTSEPTEAKKKYKGVAATRRQMLKDKATAANEPSNETVSRPPPINVKKVPTLPIFMHLITIGLFFAAGFIFSLNHTVNERVSIHRHLLAPQQHGIGLISAYKTRFNNHHKAPTARLQNQKMEWDDNIISDTGDEFDPNDDSLQNAEYVPNIDPLFQLDLDKFTKGDSLFMIGARMAVAMHRLNLFFFYYFPLSIFNALMNIPRKLIQTPPFLCVFALITRQFAKRVLGATLPPDVNANNSQHGTSSGKDILAMMKQGVMTFLSNSFPTLVELYDAFTHLKSDMFVMLFGIFVGLAYNHHYLGDELSSPLELPLDHDEL